MFSLLDGFSRYNQVLVAEDDRLKKLLGLNGEPFLLREFFGLINVRCNFSTSNGYLFSQFNTMLLYILMT
jgi:hypothetical protein